MAEGPSAFIDSNFIVRYLTNDPPAMAKRAAALLDGTEPLLLCETILMASAYVLESVYGISREVLVDALAELVQKANITLTHLPKARVLEALHLCRPSRRVSFADALLWAEAREHGAAKIYTFDRRFPAQGVAISG
ncbi:MAG TPA: PIN domain-containing protein [Thermoanaerobaculia bacterium]|nr:PIN domain-containing protein [Thermoanaerobaculia bacterium]